MMGYDSMMGSGLTVLLMMGSLLLVVVGAVLLLVWIVRELTRAGDASRPTTGNSTHNTTQETPLAILQRRYARGEIGRDEYERVRTDLRRDGDSPTNEMINKETT